MTLRLLIIGAFVSALGLAGCATKVTGLKQSESFQYQNVLNGKIAVGGVVSAIDELKTKQQMTYGNILKRQILEERKDFNVASPGLVRRKVGKTAYKNMLVELQDNGSLSPNTIANLKEKVPGKRYIVFARIESNDTDKNRQQIEKTDKEGNGTGAYRITTSARRTIIAQMQIVDLLEKNLAWSGSVTKTLSNASNFDKRRESGIVSLVKAIKGDGENADKLDKMYPYPALPKTKAVLAKVFNGFAENLPEED